MKLTEQEISLLDDESNFAFGNILAEYNFSLIQDLKVFSNRKKYSNTLVFSFSLF